MTSRSRRLDPRIEEALRGTSWEVVQKRRHLAIVVDGRQVAVLPRGYRADGVNSRSAANVLSSVRRFIRSQT